jgi:hypothetical protein
VAKPLSTVYVLIAALLYSYRPVGEQVSRIGARGTMLVGLSMLIALGIFRILGAAREIGIRTTHIPILLPYTAVLVWMGATLLWNYDSPVVQLSQLLCILMVVYFVGVFASIKARASDLSRWLARSTAAVAVGAAMFALIAQFVEVDILGLQVDRVGGQYERASGWFGNANRAATIYLLGVASIVALIVERPVSRAHGFAAGAALGLLVVGLAQSGSRTSWLLLLVVISLLFLHHQFQRFRFRRPLQPSSDFRINVRWILPLLFALGLTVIYYGRALTEGISRRLAHESFEALGHRPEFWRTGTSALTETNVMHLIVGNGFHSRYEVAGESMHNAFLQGTYEFGLVWFFLFLLLLSAILRRLVFLYNEASGWSLYAIISVVVVLGTGMVTETIYDYNLEFLHFIFVAVIAGCVRQTREVRLGTPVENLASPEERRLRS